MLKLLVASLATASALKVKSQPAVKPLSNALKLRGGVSAADVAHYGQLFLCASVGVPALVGGSDLLFKINYPGFDWDGYTSKWTPESKNYLDSMTKFFAGSLLMVGALSYTAKPVAGDIYFTILAAAQALFGAIQVFAAAPKRRCDYFTHFSANARADIRTCMILCFSRVTGSHRRLLSVCGVDKGSSRDPSVISLAVS